MTHKLQTETFSQKIEYSGGVFFWPLTPLFNFVTFHSKAMKHEKSVQKNAAVSDSPPDVACRKSVTSAQ